jgi:hypothetical protein
LPLAFVLDDAKEDDEDEDEEEEEEERNDAHEGREDIIIASRDAIVLVLLFLQISAPRSLSFLFFLPRKRDLQIDTLN